MSGWTGWLALAAMQGAVGAEPPAPGEAGVAPVELPVLRIAIDRDLSSKAMKPDAFFPIRLAEPLRVGGHVVLPAGLTGEGQVVHVSRAAGLGRAGELIVAARYLTCGDVRLNLRGFRLDGAGHDKSGTIIAAGAIGGLVATPLMFLKGGEFGVPAGSVGYAKLVDAAPPVTGNAVPCGLSEAVPVATAGTVQDSQQGVTK